MKLRATKPTTDYVSRTINFVPTERELTEAQKHLGLATLVLKRFKGLIDDKDLMMAGYIGLVRAVHDYDRSQGEFSCIAFPWIRQAMQGEVEKSGRTVIVPIAIIHRLYKVQRAADRLRVRLQREPSLKQIAEATGLNEAQVQEALSLVQNTTSLNAPDGEKDEEKIDSLKDLFQIHHKESEEMNSILYDVLAGLKPIYKKIIIQSVCEKRPLREIGKEIGLGSESVRKIKIKALNIMKSNLQAVDR